MTEVTKLFTAVIFTSKNNFYPQIKDVEYLVIKHRAPNLVETSANSIQTLTKVVENIKTPYFFIIKDDEYLVSTPPVPKFGVLNGKLITNVGGIVTIDESLYFNRPIYNTDKALRVLKNLSLQRVNVYDILKYFTSHIYGFENSFDFSVFVKKPIPSKVRERFNRENNKLITGNNMLVDYLNKFKETVVKNLIYI